MNDLFINLFLPETTTVTETTVHPTTTEVATTNPSIVTTVDPTTTEVTTTTPTVTTDQEGSSETALDRETTSATRTVEDVDTTISTRETIPPDETTSDGTSGRNSGTTLEAINSEVNHTADNDITMTYTSPGVVDSTSPVATFLSSLGVSPSVTPSEGMTTNSSHGITVTPNTDDWTSALGATAGLDMFGEL